MRITRSIVPSLFTLLNLFNGFAAIVFISQDEFYKASIFILFAAIFDMLDGVMARLIHSTSEFGAELDSISDVVSFGAAPAYMLYKAHFFQLQETGILIAALPALAGAIRLARFNVKLSTHKDKIYFTGLPIPSSALTIVSYVLFYHLSPDFSAHTKSITSIVVVALTSLAMVSTIKFDNLPRLTWRSIKQRPVVTSLFAIGIIASIITKGKLVFPLMMFYIVASGFRQVFFWLKELREPEIDIDESEAPEPELYEPD
ncbi:MAG: CDP-diacylglycerol--serine O-phosphatidyltransferase [Bacteroidetes bacterium]|nr:MAG: CDP-diacylglycerol--serine O-phosphatidyltransferase [Bacteroidota bacterium]